jgi:hypothetical protein
MRITIVTVIGVVFAAIIVLFLFSPPKPVILTNVLRLKSGVELVWALQAFDSATSVQVQYLNLHGVWSTIATLPPSQTSYVGKDLWPWQSCTFRIIAINGRFKNLTSAVTEIPETFPLKPVYTLKVYGGDFQKGTAGSYLVNPLVVQVLDESGRPFVDAPVVFSVFQDYGTLQSQANEIVNAQCILTDLNGYAQIRFKPFLANFVCRIFATVDLNAIIFTATTQSMKGPPPAPSDLKITSDDSGNHILVWQNNATNATSILVQELGRDGATWKTIATLPAKAFNYTAKEGTDDTYYHVVAMNSAGSSESSLTRKNDPPNPTYLGDSPKWIERVGYRYRDKPYFLSW